MSAEAVTPDSPPEEVFAAYEREKLRADIFAARLGGVEPVRVCACGARPDGTEGDGTGDYVDDDGAFAWICYACWCTEDYGRGSVEALEARRRARKAAGLKPQPEREPEQASETCHEFHVMSEHAEGCSLSEQTDDERPRGRGSPGPMIGETELTWEDRQELHILKLLHEFYASASVLATGLDVDAGPMKYTHAELAGAVVRLRERGWRFKSVTGSSGGRIMRFVKVGR